MSAWGLNRETRKDDPPPMTVAWLLNQQQFVNVPVSTGKTGYIDVMTRFPAMISWCDREPEGGQDFTVSQAIASVAELEAALDCFERDGRRVGFSLLAELDDCHGNRFHVGYDGRHERGFLAFSPKHLLADEAGRYQFLPIRWSIANRETAALLPPFYAHPIRRERVDFFIWPGYNPTSVMPPYCAPMPLIRQAIGQYLSIGEFSDCIGWGERADWTLKETRHAEPDAPADGGA
jgi:hypothetical protein